MSVQDTVRQCAMHENEVPLYMNVMYRELCLSVCAKIFGEWFEQDVPAEALQQASKHTILVPNMRNDSGITTEARHVIDLYIIYMYVPTIVPDVVAP